ncbi:hypothetical protein CH35J_006541 [Colletotrichum higginsianum]|uniref:Uncharacterized protein n=1 Tax=Colletotrichum higginsianum TaxID=80884 RepID=A0A4T0VWZ7_9PEZI|nr:hypothetical protein CH35J_006541 [Colletotrichum higginsianum]
MAGATSGKTIHAYSKRAKDKVRKSGDSAKRKAVQLGQEARVFSAVLHFNPTYRRLDGAVHVPEGQSIPDVNGFLAELLSRSRDPQRAPMRHQPVQDRPGGSAALHDEITAETGNIEIDANAEGTVDADADISHNIAADRNSADWIGNPRAGHDDTPTATTDPDDETQRHRGMGNDLAFFGASRDAENQEMPDGAVADGVSGHDTSIRMFDVGSQDVFEMEEAGNKAQTGRSKDISDWQVVDARNANVPTTQVARAGSARTQARTAQRFWRQVALRMRLATRRERLPLLQVAHQDRWRSMSQLI